MDRLVQRNVLAMSGRAVEAAGDCSTLLLDKTGTITYGNRMAAAFLPVGRRRRAASWPRSCCSRRSPTRRPRAARSWRWPRSATGCEARDTARRRAGAVHRPDPHVGHRLGGPPDPQGRGRLGAPLGRGARAAPFPADLDDVVEGIARDGGTPLVVAEGAEGARRHPPQGHRQAGHGRAVRRDARHGHPDDHDHRRQPAHRGRPSPRRPASTTSSPRPRPRTRWPASRPSRPAATSWP